MKTIFTIIACIGYWTAAFAQSDCRLNFEKGEKVTINSHSYINDFDYSDKFMKLKADKKEKVVEEFNQDVLSGKIAGGTYPVMVDVTEVYQADDYQEVVMKFPMGDKMATNTYVYWKDTLFIKVMDGMKYLASGTDTSGVMVFGVEKIPCKPAVGQTDLPPYMNYTLSFPKTNDIKLTIRAFSGYQTVTGVAHGSFRDSRTGEFDYGFYSYEKQVPQYTLQEVDGKMTVAYQNVTINNHSSEITRTEEITIKGKAYNAFIIESENWSKGTTDIKFFSTYQEAVDRAYKGQERMDKKFEKKFEKMGLTNDQGYVITYTKKYFVPEFGIVKTINYGLYGIIQTINVMDGVE